MEWIVTDNIRRETWRRLLEYANIDLAIEEIERRHSPADLAKAGRENIKKQAQQVRVCILQAKEYFDAAVASTIFTSPNHAYYGVMSLASAMMLLLGDGSKSLDFLRQDSGNRHHGLNFTTGCNSSGAKNGLTLLEQSHVEILRQGHFANWYSTLPQQGITSALTTVVLPSGVNFTRMAKVGHFNVPTAEALVGKKHSALELLKYLPDLNEVLYRYRVPVARCRSTHEVNQDSTTVTHMWRLHGADSAAALEAVLNGFLIRPNHIDSVTYEIEATNHGGIVQIKFPYPPAVDGFFQFPSSRETLNHDTISYAEDENPFGGNHEIVDLYLIAYQLSMSARYFPDIWISCIESQCKAAKLIEKLVDLICQKLPILMLSMLSPAGITISTHRQTWKIR